MAKSTTRKRKQSETRTTVRSLRQELDAVKKEKQHLEQDVAGQLLAIGKSQAVIELGMDGTILNANENFLRLLNYTLNEVQGQHHSLFVEPKTRASEEYIEFWNRLRARRTTARRRGRAQGVGKSAP